MRTQQEIVARYRKRQRFDPLGFEASEYLPALTRKTAESLRGDLLRVDVDLSNWQHALKTDEDVRKAMADYMPFAWEKANHCRGISAWRSLAHYQAWLWLLGEEALADLLSDYEFYGKNELRLVCDFLGIDADEWDDGRRVNSEDEA